jgi:hypothetical protein
VFGVFGDRSLQVDQRLAELRGLRLETFELTQRDLGVVFLGQPFVDGIWNNTWGAACYRDIMAVADAIKAGIGTIPELKLIGDPTFVISFLSDAVDIYHVNDFMKTRGWRYNCLQIPPALHFCVTMPQTAVPGLAERMTADLKEAVAYARRKAGTVAETTAIYGLAGTPDGNRQVTELVYGVFDYLYGV